KIKNPEFKNYIQEMFATLNKTKDGVALAAPQIGISYRIFVVSGKVINPDDEKKAPNGLVFINPKIIKLSRKKLELEEGCLSVENVYGLIKRSEKTSIEAYDENGNKISWNGSGLMSQIFQHEIDHLDGILFVDSAKNLEKIGDDKQK